jgi:hypothetical protein
VALVLFAYFVHSNTRDRPLVQWHSQKGSKTRGLVLGTISTLYADNVFGPSDPATLQAFRAAALSRPFATPAAQARKQYAAVFWVWPVFSWPNTAPVGLVTRTVVSLAWSIAPCQE